MPAAAAKDVAGARVECSMTYRDDLDAARHRRGAISRQLDDVRGRLGDRDALEQEARRLAKQLEEATANIDHARTRAHLPLLQAVAIASPCKESWASMKGSDRVRFCGRCEKHVFDLSEMTAVEAESVLTAHGVAACVRFYRRTDGTVMTSDCPEGQRRRRRRNLFLAGALAAGTMAGAGALAYSRDDDNHEQEVRGGAVASPRTPYEPGSAGGSSVVTGPPHDDYQMGAAAAVSDSMLTDLNQKP